MKGTDIFNLKAISDKIVKPKVLGVYYRIQNANKGNKTGLTEHLLNQMISIIENDSKAFLTELYALKAQLEEQRLSKKKATKKSA